VPIRNIAPPQDFGFQLRRMSVSHKILLMSRFYNKPICLADLAVINKNFHTDRPSQYYRVLDRLENAELINRYHKDLWAINEKGSLFLVYFAQQNTSPLVD
jgi:hypothetical protein